MTSPSDESRVFLLCPTAGDGPRARAMLEGVGLKAQLCASMRALCGRIERGAGCVLIAEEALEHGGTTRLCQALGKAPAWSDLPILVLTSHGLDTATSLHAFETLGNVTLLERPVSVAALTSAVRAALRARTRQ